MNFEMMQDSIDDFVETMIAEQFHKITNEQFAELATRYDRRAISRNFMSNNSGDCIAVKSINVRDLNYYAGFEYVKDDCRMQFGDYVIFSDSDDRVADMLQCIDDVSSADEE